MANNHEQFVAFHDAIKATDVRKDKLKDNRKYLRKRIRNYFMDNLPEEIQPKFHSQGSFALDTILNPIKDVDGLAAYDLDDGVYFIGETEGEKHPHKSPKRFIMNCTPKVGRKKHNQGGKAI